MTLEDLQKEVNALNEQVNFYCDERKTKVLSKNIRVALGALKNNVPEYRRLLVAEDKK